MGKDAHLCDFLWDGVINIASVFESDNNFCLSALPLCGGGGINLSCAKGARFALESYASWRWSGCDCVRQYRLHLSVCRAAGVAVFMGLLLLASQPCPEGAVQMCGLLCGLLELQISRARRRHETAAGERAPSSKHHQSAASISSSRIFTLRAR
jgi:hypothetical protein